LPIWEPNTCRIGSNIVADGSGRSGLLVSGMRLFGPAHGVLTKIRVGVCLTPDSGENWSRATVTGGSGTLSNMIFLNDATGRASGDEGVWKSTGHGNE
jgi:photosystem II stability/assembly factor-like uncharacterized protein